MDWCFKQTHTIMLLYRFDISWLLASQGVNLANSILVARADPSPWMFAVFCCKNPVVEICSKALYPVELELRATLNVIFSAISFWYWRNFWPCWVDSVLQCPNVQTINLTSFVKCEISSIYIYIYIALCESKYQVALNIIFSLAIAISDSWISGQISLYWRPKL